MYEQFIASIEKSLLGKLRDEVGDKAESVKERVAVLSDRENWLVRFSICPALTEAEEELIASIRVMQIVRDLV